MSDVPLPAVLGQIVAGYVQGPNSIFRLFHQLKYERVLSELLILSRASNIAYVGRISGLSIIRKLRRVNLAHLMDAQRVRIIRFYRNPEPDIWVNPGRADGVWPCIIY